MAFPRQLLLEHDIVLEDLPDEVAASMERRDQWMGSLPYPAGGLEFLVADLQSWSPGEMLRVAFLGGAPELYGRIEEAAESIVESANVTLSFQNRGAYRTWSTGDTDYAAEIRISFDQNGYFSLVGTDSMNPSIGLPLGAVGGRPNQRSLNLGGYDKMLPAGWEGTIRHEFLHALAFHHEHQNMRGPCESAFRWEDDAGYQPTRDARGAYILDRKGLRPGIYTYLSGFPNGWTRAKVDFNLRTDRSGQSTTAGPFDAASVMLYRFPELFYRTLPSPCAPVGDGLRLSAGDIRGLQLLYPRHDEACEAIADRREALLTAVETVEGDGLESKAGALAPLNAHAAKQLRASVAQLRRPS